MTHLIDTPSPAASVERDRFGRPLVLPPGGGKPTAYTRATTLASTLDDTFGLTQWEKRMVATGLSQRPDLLLAVSANTDPSDEKQKTELTALTDQAKEAAKASAASTTGTALHALAERIDRGEELGTVPGSADADLAAYREATACLNHVLIEQFLVNDELRVGGTPDRFSYLAGDDGLLRAADIKTGQISYSAGKIAMQLAIYAHCRCYDPATGDRWPLPGTVDQQWGIVIHLPAGQAECRLYWVDLARGWDAVQLATQVRSWRRAKGLLQPLASAEAESAANDSAAMAIQTAGTIDELYATYYRLVESGVDREVILPLCRARKSELEGAT